MLGKESNRLQLIDAFSVLTWADIVEATDCEGHLAQIYDRGYRVDRVKVRNHRRLYADLRTRDLTVQGENLDFVGEHAYFSYLLLEITPSMIVDDYPGTPVPNPRLIRISDEGLSELRQAIAEDINDAFANGPNDLREYLNWLRKYCNSWNSGNLGELYLALLNHAESRASSQLRVLSDEFCRCFLEFQGFYLSQNIFPAANDILSKAHKSPIHAEMAERLSARVLKRATALLNAFESELENNIAKPNILISFRLLKDFLPNSFPFKAIESFLRNVTYIELSKALDAERQIKASNLPTSRIILKATSKFAKDIKGLLHRSQYTIARNLYVRNISAFRKNAEIRCALISAFKKCRRGRELEYFSTQINSAFLSVFSQLHCFEYPQPELEPRDYHLISTWNGRPLDTSADASLNALSIRLGPYRAIQHFAARSAERVALQIYRDIEGDASDISFDQISGSSRSWIYADVETAGRYIDIKSARSSFTRGDRYSEFCVKRFKKINYELDVQLSGFFSQYKNFTQIEDGDTPTYQWLGELSGDRFERSVRFIHSNFGSIFSIDDFRRNIKDTKFIPGWLFDYPESVYKYRGRHIESLNRLMARARWRAAIPSSVPEPGLLLAFQERLPRESQSERLISNALCAMLNQEGLDRGLLFMTIIAVCLTAGRRNIGDFQPDLFRRFLFFDESDDSKLIPLGIYDPLGYIDELIDCLGTVFQNSRGKILDFRSFKLVGYGILQGKSAHDTHWTTILAYCGGRDQGLNVRCGNTPLVLGVHESCPLCRKLVCNQCGFCSDGCENCYAWSTEKDESKLSDDSEHVHGHGSSDSDIPF